MTALEDLRVAVEGAAWLGKVRNNVDETAMSVVVAARRLLEEGPDKSGGLPTVRESGPAPLELARFHVMGLPAPQGSKTWMPKQRVMVESGRKRLTPWRDAVVEAANKVVDEAGPWDEPVRVTATFRLPMPKSRPKYVQRLQVWPSAVKPDLDKLVRSLLDGMVQGGLLRDDSIVCELVARKVEVIGWTGVDVRVSQVTRPTAADILTPGHEPG